MEIEVWTTKSDCWACEEPMVVWYPPIVGSHVGGTWDPVGEHLAELPDAPIDHVYSETQDKFVWGNVCDHCGEYNGNHYVHVDAVNAMYNYGRDAIRNGEVAEYDVITVDIPLSCTQCGSESVRLPTPVCNDCFESIPDA